MLTDKISHGQVGKAVVIGAGAIGIEMAEALTDLWGVETTIVEMADHVLPAALGRNISKVVENHLKEREVKVLLSDRVEKINGDPESGVTSVKTGNGTLACDMVVMSAGIRPNTGLAKEAEPFIEKYKDKWMNIPQNELRDRLDEVPADEPLCLVCGTGACSYESQVLLNQRGFSNICNVQGGHAMLMATDQDFI